MNWPVNTRGLSDILEPHREMRRMTPSSYRYSANYSPSQSYSYTPYPRESVSQPHPFACTQPRLSTQHNPYEERDALTSSTGYPPPLSHPSRETASEYRSYSSCQRESVGYRPWPASPATVSIPSPQMREIAELRRSSCQHLVSANSAENENNTYQGRYFFCFHVLLDQHESNESLGFRKATYCTTCKF